jgi:hypothetical protein
LLLLLLLLLLSILQLESGIGAESDSYYETLFKSWAVFQEKKFYEQFKEVPFYVFKTYYCAALG